MATANSAFGEILHFGFMRRILALPITKNNGKTLPMRDEPGGR
jgi:hypothetical protein